MKNTIEEKIVELNQLVLNGKALEAFEKFYHPNVSMQENENAPTVGKDANRDREIEFFGNITDFRGAEIKGVAIGDNLSTVIWHYDYTHKEWGVRKYTQVSVQHWQDGQIIKEQFFYAT
ncbi:MAG: SnoaL-like domain-containing protein [Bacteroidota bacterium]